MYTKPPLSFLSTTRSVHWLLGLALMATSLALPGEATSTPVRILPLGDSVTQAASFQNSYRRALWNLLQSGGYDVDFVGSIDYNFSNVSPPNSDFDRDHDGHWGWRIDEILNGCTTADGCNGGSGSGQLSTWLGGYTPDIVLVHLGTNDVIQCQSISSSVSELKQLIDVLRSDNPRVTVLLAKVIPMTRSFPCGSDNSDLTALNNQMAGIASDKSTAQSPVQVVDLNTGFNAGTDTYDGIHPNTSGEQKMANGWYAALQPILNNRVSLDLDMVLAAAFSGGQMTNTLNTSSLLPLSHPYTDSKYAGTDRFVAAAETVPSGWFGSRTDLVDWVVVQLKSSVFSAPVASRAAFVKRDGTVVDLDGESPVAFTAAPGTYYVAVAHRNHLPAVSATLVDLSSGSGAYDFTTASAFGTNALTTVGGQLALWAGDADGDTGVNARDAIYIQARLGSGYSDSDLDLNGSASVSDLTLIWPGSNGRPSGIPRTATKVELERMK